MDILMKIFSLILIISLIWYFLWLIFSRMHFLKNKKYTKFLFITILTIALYLFVSNLFFSSLLEPESLKFNKTQWMKNDLIRYQMIKDLRDKKTLIEKDSAEIKSLLGFPNTIDSLKTKWTYFILTNNGFDHEMKKLEIKFMNGISSDISYK